MKIKSDSIGMLITSLLLVIAYYSCCAGVAQSCKQEGDDTGVAVVYAFAIWPGLALVGVFIISIVGIVKWDQEEDNLNITTDPYNHKKPQPKYSKKELDVLFNKIKHIKNE